jgi:hypothetical protein
MYSKQCSTESIPDYINNRILTKKAAEATKQKRKKPKPEELEGICHRISTALLQSIAKIRTKSESIT